MSEANNDAINKDVKSPEDVAENVTRNISETKLKSAPKSTSYDYSKTASDDLRPIIQKRGGIGLITATLLSSVAAVGGAYLALFVQARPDVVDTLKIGAFLPKPANLKDLDGIQKDIASLRQDVAKIGNNQQVPFVAAPADTPKSDGQVAPTTAPTTAPNTQNQLAPTPLQNTQPNPQQVQAAAQATSFEPIKADIAGLSGRLTAIETRLAALDPTGTGGAIIAALQTEIATLKVTVQDLQQKIAQTPSPATTFAVISLAEAANRNGTFVPEYEALRGALPFLPEVTALEPYAKSGAPTRSLLREEFENLAADIVKNANKPKEEKGFFGFFKNIFANAFKVEVKDKNNPNTIDEIIGRAKAKLNLDDLQGAIAELKNLQTPPQSVTDWIANAQKRQDLEVKISALRAAIERNIYSQQLPQQYALPTLQTLPQNPQQPVQQQPVQQPVQKPANPTQTNPSNAIQGGTGR